MAKKGNLLSRLTGKSPGDSTPGALTVVAPQESDLFSPFSPETSKIMKGPPRGGEMMMIYSISAMVVLSILIMSVLKLDRVVVAQGKVSAAGGPLFVQPLDRSIVKSVLVRAGDTVKKDQVLAILDPTFAAADLTQMQQKQASTAALVKRLQAELAGQAYVPDKLSPYEVLQLGIWRQRQQEYQQSVLAYDSKIRAAQSDIARNQQDASGFEQKLKLSSELESMQTKLIEKGYGSRMQEIAASQDRVEAQRLLSESRNQIASGSHNVSSLLSEKSVFTSKWRDDTGAALVQAQNELDQANQYLSKANKQSDLTSLRAPDDAVVLQVGDASKGSIVDSNAVTKPLFTLVPVKGATEADVTIDAKDIGFVKPGDKARVKFDAYRFTQHGTADAVIETISEGSFTTDDNGQNRPPFFKARIKFTKVALHNVPEGFRLVPGMTMQADVLVGRRTILSYLLEGALRTGSEAMREPQ